MKESFMVFWSLIFDINLKDLKERFPWETDDLAETWRMGSIILMKGNWGTENTSQAEQSICKHPVVAQGVLKTGRWVCVTGLIH